MTVIDFEKRKNKIIEDRFDKMLNSNVVYKKSPTTIKWMKRIRDIITDRFIDTGKESTIDDITKAGINRNIVRRYIREVNGWGVVCTQKRKSFKAKSKDGPCVVGIKVSHYAPTKTYLKLAIEKRKK